MPGSATHKISAYTLRIDADKLDRLAEIAEAENRTLAGELRQLITERIAQFEKAAA